MYNPINVITLTGQVVTVDRARERSRSYNMEYHIINRNNKCYVYVGIKNASPLQTQSYIPLQKQLHTHVHALSIYSNNTNNNSAFLKALFPTIWINALYMV